MWWCLDRVSSHGPTLVADSPVGLCTVMMPSRIVLGIGAGVGGDPANQVEATQMMQPMDIRLRHRVRELRVELLAESKRSDVGVLIAIVAVEEIVGVAIDATARRECALLEREVLVATNHVVIHLGVAMSDPFWGSGFLGSVQCWAKSPKWATIAVDPGFGRKVPRVCVERGGVVTETPEPGRIAKHRLERRVDPQFSVGGFDEHAVGWFVGPHGAATGAEDPPVKGDTQRGPRHVRDVLADGVALMKHKKLVDVAHQDPIDLGDNRMGAHAVVGRWFRQLSGTCELTIAHVWKLRENSPYIYRTSSP